MSVTQIRVSTAFVEAVTKTARNDSLLREMANVLDDLFQDGQAAALELEVALSDVEGLGEAYEDGSDAAGAASYQLTTSLAVTERQIGLIVAAADTAA